MLSFPSQKLPSSQKDKKWQIACLDSLCNYSLQFSGDWKKMQENFEIKNSQLNPEDYRKICEGLGVKDDPSTRKYIEAYNICSNIIETLMGEELNRPWSFNVVNDNPEESNKIIRQKEREYQKILMDLFKSELEKQDKIKEIQDNVDRGQMQQSKANNLLSEINRVFNERQDKILNLKEVEARYKSKQTVKEIFVRKLMRSLVNRQNLKWVKNATFEDAIVAGQEFVEVVQMSEYELPIVKQLDVLNVFYHKSPNTPFIQDGEFAGYREYMTVTSVLKKFGDDLSDDDRKKIEGRTLGGVYGVDQPFFGKGEGNANDFGRLQRSGQYPSLGGASAQQYGLSDNPNDFISSPYGGYNTVRSKGLYATQNNIYRQSYCTVYTVYWLSERKIGVIERYDENGEYNKEFVSEDFILPKDAELKKVQLDPFSKPKSKYTWLDENDNLVQLEWIWIPEVWTGTRINSDIYVNIRPLKHAYQSLINPFNVKLPIYGYVYNNRNAYSSSIMDKVKVWQKLYYVIMAKFLKQISKDHGILTFLNVLFIDGNLGLEKTLELAEETGIVPYNPLANTTNAGMLNTNTMKIAERVDATNAQVVQYYMELLRFIEEKMQLVSGMSPQRLAQTQSRSNASDNQRDTMHSMNITERFFSGHDLLWQEVLQGLMEMSLSVISTKEGKHIVRDLLNDEEMALVDLEILSIYDDFKLRVGSDSKSYRILQQLQGNAQALIQNGLPLSQLVSLMQKEDLLEFKEELKQIEDLERKERLAQQDAENQIAREKIQAMRDQVEDQQIADLDNTYLKGQLNLQKEDLRGQYLVKSYNLESDLNNNSVPDVLEYNLKSGDLMKRAEQRDKELAIKERDQMLKEAKAAKELELKANQQLLDSKAKETELALKDKHELQKNETELEKAKLSASKRNNKD